MDQFWIRPFCPTPRGRVKFVRENAHSNRNGGADALDSEERRSLVLPVETSAGKRGIREPGDRDVVEDVVAHKAFRLSFKNALDEFIAARIVVKKIGRQADG